MSDRHRDYRLLDFRGGAVLHHRLAPADLLQRQLAAFVVELLEAVEAVAAVAHHFAGLADITELLGQLQQPELGSDDLLFLGHSWSPSLCRRAGRGPSSWCEPRPASGASAKTNNDCQIKFELLQVEPVRWRGYRPAKFTLDHW